MATFYKFGKLWEIPPAAARLGKSLPANTQAFETLLTNLEPMLSAFITAHPRCPKDPDLPAIRYAIKEFMEEQAPSNFFKERWAASYDPARKVTYVSWFLGTVAYFLDKLDFTTLVALSVETKFPVFISGSPYFGSAGTATFGATGAQIRTLHGTVVALRLGTYGLRRAIMSGT